MRTEKQSSGKKARRLLNKLQKKRTELLLIKNRSNSEFSLVPETSERLMNRRMISKGGVGQTLDHLLRDLEQTKRDVKNSKDNSPKQEQIRINLTIDKLRGRPLGVSDVQDLILFSCLGPGTHPKPKWVTLKPSKAISQVIVVIVEINQPQQLIKQQIGTSINGLIQDKFPFIRRYFYDRVILKQPGSMNDFYDDILRVPISPRQIVIERLRKERLNGNFKPKASGSGGTTNIEDLLVSNHEMVEFDYPLPLHTFDQSSTSSCSSMKSGSNNNDYNAANDHQQQQQQQVEGWDDDSEDGGDFSDSESEEFVFTKPAYSKVTNDSPVYALDCEMCLVGYTNLFQSHQSLLTPFALNLNRFDDISHSNKRKIGEILPSDAILVGHSLNYDLKAMKMYHPYVVDLSIIYNLSGSRQLKSSLQTLAHTFLGEEIQSTNKGHCSIEDSWATMKLFQAKVGNSLDFGNVELGWSYPEYAAGNGLSSTGARLKRSRAEEPEDEKLKEAGLPVHAKSDTPPLKRRKLLEAGDEKEAGEEFCQPSASKPTSGQDNDDDEDDVSTCTGCQDKIQYPGCRNKTCACRRTKHLSCPTCNSKPSSSSKKLEPEIIPDDQKLDWGKALGLSKVTAGREDSLIDYLNSGRKGLFFISAADQNLSERAGFDGSNLINKGGKKRPFSHRFIQSSKDGITQKFREHILEHELCVMQTDLDLSESEEVLNKNCSELDENLSKIIHSSAKQSLLTIIFVPKPPTNGNEELLNDDSCSSSTTTTTAAAAGTTSSIQPLACLRVKI